MPRNLNMSIQRKEFPVNQMKVYKASEKEYSLPLID
jgi:hypothetical protein